MNVRSKGMGISRIEKSPGIPAMVANQVIDLISEGRLKPGDKLPSEQEMTELFGISRISLREAMKLLEAKGYIESRDRKGKFVRSLVDTMKSPIEDMISFDHEKIWELLAVRRIIDSEAAFLAAGNATKKQVNELRKITAKTENLGFDSVLFSSEGGKYYSDFFDILSDATRNTIFVHLRGTVVTVLNGVFPYSRKKLSLIEDSSLEIFSQLKRIRIAVENADAEEAKAATIDHIDYIEKSLKEVIAKS